MIASPYTIHSPKYWMVEDKPHHSELLFHLYKDDYFGTLATVLSLIEETFDSENREWKLKALKKAVSDLTYLQENYKITEKQK